MNSRDLIQYINAPESEPVFAALYGPGGVQRGRARYSALIEGLGALHADGEGVRVFTAAGRTELGGNHTDHNNGKVLAASIQLDAAAAAAEREDRLVFFRSTGYPDVELDLADLDPHPEEYGKTEALIRGIAADFARRGVAVRGVAVNADSTVLPGSGLSSSAAVEVLFCTIFDKLYGGGALTALETAHICRKAENEYFGKPCGLMDQCACAFGGAVAIDFADPEHPRVARINVDFEALGYALCVVNTRGNHADLTEDYASVSAEMRAVARYFGKDALREVDGAALAANTAGLRARLGDRALLRAMHFFKENERVDAMYGLLAAGGADIERYFEQVRRSGASSWELLQNVYSPGNPREQGISLALALTEDFFDRSGRRGACRVHGGGFAGTIQAYIPLGALEEYRRCMETVFGAGALTVLRIRPTGAAELEFERCGRR
jgi:galactokinase